MTEGISYTQPIQVTAGNNSSAYSATFDSAAPSIFVLGRDCDTFVPDGDNSVCRLSAMEQGGKQVSRGAITDLSGKPISSENPAHFGPYYVMYLTGLAVSANIENANPVGVVFPSVQVNEPGGATTAGSQVPEYAGESSYYGVQQINFQLNGNVFGGAAASSSGVVYPPEWPCGTRLETVITVQQGGGANNSDAHSISIPIVIEKGEIPCL